MSTPISSLALFLNAFAVSFVYCASPAALVVPAAASGLKPDSAKQINKV